MKFRKLAIQTTLAMMLVVVLSISAFAANRESFDFAWDRYTSDNFSAPTFDQEIIKVLFFGMEQQTAHSSQTRLRELAPALLDRGIHLVYVHEDPSYLTLENLNQYDALLVYGNWIAPTPFEAIEAVVKYVESGGALVAIHSASAHWTNSDWIPLIGGQFQRHPRIEVMTTEIQNADHPVIAGFTPFQVEDEPYIHRNHNEANRTVLEVSTLAANAGEPWTWVREQGEGRVFYTAWGHDARTWTHTGFHDLIERAIVWTSGRDVQEHLANRKLSNPFIWTEAPAFIPVYQPGVSGQARIPVAPLPIWPQESMTRMIVPAGFEISLFASEPFVTKVIDFNWDEQGRMWVLESPDYPYHVTDNWDENPVGRDRLVILEDTNGDGRADKRTVWADNLNIPQSFAFWNDGVVIGQQPFIYFFKDTDGDGKADHREILVSGTVSTRGGQPRGDTHAGPTAFHYGFDNRLWGTCGNNCGGQPWTRSIWSMDPDTATGRNRSEEFQIEGKVPCNSAGLDFSEEGHVFASTATCGAPSLHLPIQAKYYDKVDGLNTPTLASLPGNVFTYHIDPFHRQVEAQNWHRTTASPGHELYTARAFPERFWNSVGFVNEPAAGTILPIEFAPNGGTFSAKYSQALLVSDDSWVSPIGAKVGPDGAVWVIDWYNIIIQHNPTPSGFTATNAAYVTPNRENLYSRIYRIAWEDAPEYTPINLANAATADLVNALKNDNQFWRLTAQRLIVQEGNIGVAPLLLDLIADQSVDAIGLNPGAIHALWTLHGLGLLDGTNDVVLEAAVGALKHPSAGVRLNAVQVLPARAQSRDAILAADLLNDADAQVRLHALLALSNMPASADAGKAIFAMLTKEENANDRWIRDAATIAANQHRAGFLEAAELSETVANVVRTW